ncbi:hypothetical protein P9265_18360 [Schinkia azotoformans]|uniref:hypothetical protein n=1 Tax=Schinkia azotoformans TaxID=1454 RepID=UPI002DB740B3|nr:hypothetical protein [Schinkia azotoformans]MEC1720099.1 hypothetical protein [Schinkia azotoformans]MED4354258.1 hypothetical protein [Schinkia azotoformans]MED4414186.1 hypothetical protein [Schinkia azotoformans]
MGQLKIITQSFILLFSEALWMYYVIVLNTSLEWQQVMDLDIKWWIAAWVVGYFLNKTMAGKMSFPILFLTNSIILLFIIVQNWKMAVPEGHLFLGIVLSSAVAFVFLRSAFLNNRIPTRMQMVRHFEGNILLYIIFAICFTANEWMQTDAYHAFFITAIILSLMGIVFSLQSNEKEQIDETMEIRKVGHSTWFTGVITAIFTTIILLSFLFLIPSLRGMLLAITMNSWEALKWGGSTLLKGLTWLISLFPTSETKGTLPMNENGEMKLPDQVQEETLIKLPLLWIFGGIACIATLLFIWLIAKYSIRIKPAKSLRIHHVVIDREPWWLNFKRKFIQLIIDLKKKWFMKFPRFYKSPLFWYFYQVQKWGRKHGILRLRTETSKEFMEKVISSIPTHQNTFSYNNKNYQLSDLLLRLLNDYQAAYYGSTGETSIDDYKVLISQLKEIR